MGRARSAAAAGAFLLALVAANALTAHLGLIPAGFGLTVTAGTYCAGLTLALRDVLHEVAGARAVVAVVAVGAGVTALFAPGLAAASAAAFVVGELVDLAVFVRLRARGWLPALVGSNAVGALVDTAAFVAFAGLPFTVATVVGQFVVKAVWVTGLFVLGVVVWRAVSRQRFKSPHP
ncbi:VUT family protein [Crossiella sp. NPDC003009]